MRDNIASFREVETEPFGVNPGSAASHREFIAENNFPFELLVDENLDVAKQYGAVNDEGTGISRTVVIVGKNGKVIFKQAGAPSPILLLNAINAASDGA